MISVNLWQQHFEETPTRYATARNTKQITSFIS